MRGHEFGTDTVTHGRSNARDEVHRRTTRLPGHQRPTLLVLSLGIGLCCCPGKRAERSDQLGENAELKGLGALPVIGSDDLGAANPSISSRSL